MNTASIRNQSSRVVARAPSRHRSELDNSVARYTRVAMVETVLTIRDRQRQWYRTIAVAVLFSLGVLMTAAGFLGWF